MNIPTPYLIGAIAVASVLVGIGVQRFVAWYISRRLEEGTDIEKPMTYSEAMANLAKVGPAETSRKRRLKKRKKPEVVTLSMLRYGEYSTDDSKLTIQAWRPDPTHRLAGHVVVDIIPKPSSEEGAMTLSSVRRLAIDLETVDAARVVKLADGEAIVLAVSDYEVKGQGVIFKDLDYAQGVGVDSTTLYIVLVVKNVVGLAPQADLLRKQEFRSLARGLDIPSPKQQSTKKMADDVAAPESSRPEPEKVPLVGNEVGGPSADTSSPSEDDRGLHLLPDTTVSHFFHHTFRSVF